MRLSPETSGIWCTATAIKPEDPDGPLWTVLIHPDDRQALSGALLEANAFQGDGQYLAYTPRHPIRWVGPIMELRA